MTKFNIPYYDEHGVLKQGQAEISDEMSKQPWWIQAEVLKFAQEKWQREINGRIIPRAMHEALDGEQ